VAAAALKHTIGEVNAQESFYNYVYFSTNACRFF